MKEKEKNEEKYLLLVLASTLLLGACSKASRISYNVSREAEKMNRLKELRKEKGLSQQALGKAIGVSYRTVQNWENGVNQIKPDKAQVLADYFGVSAGYFLGYENEGDPPVEAQLVLGKMLVDTIEYIEKSAWLAGQKQTLFVNGHEYKVTVEKVGVRK